MERPVESGDHLVPRDVALGHAVELLLDVGREIIVDDRCELLFEVVVHQHTDIGGLQPVLLLAEALAERLGRHAAARERQLFVGALLPLLALLDHITAVDDRRDGRCIGRRAADTQLFEPLDQRRLVVARRRHRETLRGRNGLIEHLVARREFGQQPFAVLGRLLVGRLRIEPQETVETHHFARGNELFAAAVDRDRDRRAVQLGRNHLRSDRALPDQVVEPLFGRRTLDRLPLDIRRADRLVRLLSPFGLGLVVMVRRILLAVEIRDLLLALRQRQRREVHRVGTHVGDETLLVEVLRDGHGLRNRHPQLAPRLLLQRG